jgi:hypothetical protein
MIMRQKTTIIARAITAFFFVTASLAVAQDSLSPRTSPSPEDAFSTRELVAWSYMQTPQPAPKPLPLPDDQIAREDQQRIAQSDAQLFIGKIVKDSGIDTLQASNATFILDGLIDARSENQNVRILGTQQKAAGGKIHVLRIELLR